MPMRMTPGRQIALTTTRISCGYVIVKLQGIEPAIGVARVQMVML